MSTIYFAKSYKKIFFLVYNKKNGSEKSNVQVSKPKKEEI